MTKPVPWIIGIIGVVFIGMGATVLAVVQGRPTEDTPPDGYRDSFRTGAPVVLFLALVLLLGVYIPPPLDSLLDGAANLLGGQR